MTISTAVIIALLLWIAWQVGEIRARMPRVEVLPEPTRKHVNPGDPWCSCDECYARETDGTVTHLSMLPEDDPRRPGGPVVKTERERALADALATAGIKVRLSGIDRNTDVSWARAKGRDGTERVFEGRGDSDSAAAEDLIVQIKQWQSA
jgi:hypothetical protein